MHRIHLIHVLLLAAVVIALSALGSAQVSISVRFGPPPLPVYEQPPCPEQGYIWTPGYWAYDPSFGDYYWVPGTWVQAPEAGYLWTPAYWGWGGEGFIFHEGYWGPRVGFYGGIDYGFGYFGEGYQGGRWDNGRFFYNRSVNNVNVTRIHNVYNVTVVKHVTVNRISYNGGQGGINARPRPEDEAAAHERHLPPERLQTQHVQEARSDRQLRASVNKGRPPIAATPRPAAWHDHDVVKAKAAGGAYHPPAHNGPNNARPEGNHPNAEEHANPSVPRPGNNNRPSPPVHARDIPAHTPPGPPNTGNAKRDQKYQQQQDKLYSKQQQERQKLEQKQERDHQKLQQQKANDTKNQQVERKHQQQTQRMEQKHTQQEEKLQRKEQPKNKPGPQDQRPR